VVLKLQPQVRPGSDQSTPGKVRFRLGQAQARKRYFEAELQDFKVVLKLLPQVRPGPVRLRPGNFEAPGRARFRQGQAYRLVSTTIR